MAHPLTDKLGKLSLAILENFVENKLGKDFIDEFRGPYETKISIVEALTHTEERFIHHFTDADLSKAMFVDLSQRDRPVLQQAVEKFYQHPTDPSFPKALQAILLGDFPYLSRERVELAVNYYVELLTEELALVNKSFQDNVRTIATLRQEKILTEILHRIDTSKQSLEAGVTPASHAQVQLIIEGTPTEFDSNRQADLVAVLAALLRIDRESIKVLRVLPGSIRVDILLPWEMVEPLKDLARRQDRRLKEKGIIRIKVDDTEIELQNSVRYDNAQHVDRKIAVHPDWEKALKELGPLPSDALLIGIAADGFPVLLNLSDPAPGPMLIVGDPGSGKTALLQTIAYLATRVKAPKELQFTVLTNHPAEWTAFQSLPHCVGIFSLGEKSSERLLDSLFTWATRSKPRSKQVILLLLDGLDTISKLDSGTQERFRSLLQKGPSSYVWPIATVSPQVAVSIKSWIDLFRFFVIGQIQNEKSYEFLPEAREVAYSSLIAGQQFVVPKQKEPLLFYV